MKHEDFIYNIVVPAIVAVAVAAIVTILGI